MFGLMRIYVDKLPIKMKRSLSKEASVWRDTIITMKKDGQWAWNMLDFSDTLGAFADPDSLRDRGFVDLKCWWVLYGSSTPNLQALTLKLLGQLCSSSCCERNWSTYSFIHFSKRNKLTPARAEDLVYVHNILCLLSQNSEEHNEEEIKMWDIGGDGFESFQGAGILDFITLSLDEPTMEALLFADDGGDNEEVIGLVSTSSWDIWRRL